jgi:hypothetical protein
MKYLLVTLLAAASAAACHAAKGGTVPGPQKVSVHDVLTKPSLVGMAVEVTGRCLGYSVPTIAKGSPPVTRSDWQLEDQGEAVWVTGPMPDGCSATTPAPAAGPISALVAQDTMPGLGGRKPAVRQYLVRR